MNREKINKLTISGMLLAVGIILPFVSAHGMGIAGTVLLPMHIPVMLCGFLCGPFYGAVTGAVLPFLNSFITAMPALYPMAVIMSGELMVYGLVTGLLYKKTKLGRIRFGIYPALIAAMLLGRCMYGLIFSILFSLDGQLKAPAVWTAAVTGIPGIIIQLVIVPIIVSAIMRYPAFRQKKTVKSAVKAINEDKAACLIIKNGKVIKALEGRGVSPIIQAGEIGILDGAVVVDKVVGKAAAMVMTNGKIKACHAVTVSRHALDWFNEKGVDVEYDNCVDYIVNRSGDGMCPMESTVLELTDDSDIIGVLKARLEQMRK